MITTFATNSGIGLTGDVAPRAIAYVDAEWIAPEPFVAVPAIVVEREHGAADPDVLAARLILQLCGEAAAAVEGTPPNEVEVWGRGVVAVQTAALLGIAAVNPGGRTTRSSAIIDTTGDPLSIAEATRRLADLGTLVLVGEELGRQLSLDLYSNVHSRGLRIVGVRRPSGAAADEPRQPGLVDGLTSTLTDARLGSSLVVGGAWYRVA